jgi:hypothetical protein
MSTVRGHAATTRFGQAPAGSLSRGFVLAPRSREEIHIYLSHPFGLQAFDDASMANICLACKTKTPVTLG